MGIRSQYVQQLSALAPGHDNKKPHRHPKIGPPHDAAGSRLWHNFAAIARVDLAMRIDGWWLGEVVPAWACSCACKLRRLEFPEGQRSLPSDSLPSLSCAWLRGLCCVVLRCVCVCLSLSVPSTGSNGPVVIFTHPPGFTPLSCAIRGPLRRNCVASFASLFGRDATRASLGLRSTLPMAEWGRQQVGHS